jgi:hypothetical protein
VSAPHGPHRLGWLLAVPIFVGLGTLGWVWMVERTRERPAPHLDAAEFEPVAAPAGDAAPGAEHWLIAVNPACVHCASSVSIARRRASSAASAPRLTVLVVDTRSRPGAPVTEMFPDAEIWWDRRSVWRRRWGYRIYGEVLCFTASGEYVRRLTPTWRQRTADTVLAPDDAAEAEVDH